MRQAIGERLIPIMIPNSAISPRKIPGIQAMGWGPNVERDAKGEFGTVGELKSWILYKNESGSLDIEDLGKLDQFKAILCGQDPSESIQFLDWANIDTVDMYLNQYDEQRQYFEKCALLIGVDVSPQSKESNLEGVGATQRFDFTAKRAIEIMGAEAYLESFKGDGTKRDFQFKRPALEFPRAKRATLIHFLPFDYALKAWTINQTTGEVKKLSMVDCQINDKGVIINTPITADEELFVLHLTDPKSEEITDDQLLPVMIEARAAADDLVVVLYSEEIDASSVTASDFSVSGTVPDAATRTAANEITLDYTTTGSVILADQVGVLVTYQQGTLKDLKDNLALTESILTS